MLKICNIIRQPTNLVCRTFEKQSKRKDKLDLDSKTILIPSCKQATRLDPEPLFHQIEFTFPGKRKKKEPNTDYCQSTYCHREGKL